MDHMTLSHNVESQAFCAIIQVNHSILNNYTISVCKHMYELKKVLNLEKDVQIKDVHFVQMSLVDFDPCYVIT
jgi:hypothetical protein